MSSPTDDPPAADRYWMTEHGPDLLHIQIDQPSSPLLAQQHLWCAARAGYVAAGLTPVRVTIEITPAGNLRAALSGAWAGLVQDPHAEAHRAVIASVADAALLSLGYRRRDS